MEEFLKDIYEKYKEQYANPNDLAEVLTRRTSRTIIPEFTSHQSLSFKEREKGKSRLDALNEMFKNRKTQITTAPPVVTLPKSKWEIDLSTPGNTIVTTPTAPITVQEAPTKPQQTATATTGIPTKTREVTTEPTTRDERKKLLFQKYMQYGASVDFARLLISQDQLEQSNFNPQGKFNYGNLTVGGYKGGAWKGVSTAGRDRDGSGKPIRQQFREYASVDEYVQDKLAFLRDLYGITGNESIDEFANKLKGGNKDKRHYAESGNYIKNLKNVYNKTEIANYLNQIL